MFKCTSARRLASASHPAAAGSKKARHLLYHKRRRAKDPPWYHSNWHAMLCSDAAARTCPLTVHDLLMPAGSWWERTSRWRRNAVRESYLHSWQPIRMDQIIQPADVPSSAPGRDSKLAAAALHQNRSSL